MSVSAWHLFRQGPMIATIFQATLQSLSRRSKAAKPGTVETPGPLVTATLPPRNAKLIYDFIQRMGGDADWYDGVVPPHLFPQWGLPLLAQTMRSLPYPMNRMLNGGCEMEIRGRLPMNEPLRITANLEKVDDNGHRAIIRQRLVTGTASSPEALVCYVNAIVVLKRSKDGAKKERPHVPDDARKVGQLDLTKRSGLDFALLTGGFNPIHWISFWARMSGFTNTILHGFATMSLTLEMLNRELWGGHPDRLQSIEVRFTRPLVLPARPSVYIDENGGVFLGDMPGQAAYLIGQYTVREESKDE